jgi:protein involved in polysaccharide export with SLBB domain
MKLKIHQNVSSLLVGTCLASSQIGSSAKDQVTLPTSAPSVENNHGRADAVKLTPPSYRLVPNDTIHIRVFQEDELETTARIAKDGTISFPLVGSVPLGGKTLAEANASIIQALKIYLINPQIALRITEYSKRRFTILGQVNRPGIFDMPDENPLSLLEGIGLAGGYSRIANPSKVTVKRHRPDGEQIFHLDAKEMAKSKTTPAFQILPGDTVIVEESIF